MHRIEDIEIVMMEFFNAYRGIMLALPGRLAVSIAPEMSPVEASEIIRKEVYLAMEEMANHKFDPKKYEALVRERKGLKPRDSNDDAVDE